MNKIHHTVGVYPDGSIKCNGVSSQFLEGHIEYNKLYRFGRALIVDGVCVYPGFVSEKTIAETLEKLKSMPVPTTDTSPYW